MRFVFYIVYRGIFERYFYIHLPLTQISISTVNNIHWAFLKQFVKLMHRYLFPALYVLSFPLCLDR